MSLQLEQHLGKAGFESRVSPQSSALSHHLLGNPSVLKGSSSSGWEGAGDADGE